MSLWRLPFTSSAAYCMYVSLTPPNATPPAAECRELDSEYFTPYVIMSLKTIFFSMFILDTIAILQLVPTTWSTPATCQMRVSSAFIAAWILTMAGLVLRVACYRILARFFTFELAIRKDHRLITYGPYVYVRHPSYLGGAMVQVGYALGFTLPGSWFSCVRMTPLLWVGVGIYVLVIVSVMYISRMKKEDEMLLVAFGEEWESWRRDVPYRMIPKVY